ncbi:hypothetical protein TIFTF001_025930 [Ficus carica]|uniref:Uncharacterized protein n=1 Tax=Ficus carica TaxID=3494 RepID=A0AA88ARI8_FICCA|nr:hypothetical protein TIFTF001_025930 [Ficus carica]
MREKPKWGSGILERERGERSRPRRQPSGEGRCGFWEEFWRVEKEKRRDGNWKEKLISNGGSGCV